MGELALGRSPKARLAFLAALSGTLAGLALVPRAAWAQSWKQKAELTASDGAEADSLGSEVAIAGSTLVATAASKAVGSNAQQGAAYVYAFDGSRWHQQAELTASDGATNDFFGTSVALSGDSVVVGASNKTLGSSASQGAAYVYSFDGSSWMQQAELVSSDGASSDQFGSSVAIWGNTAVVGAPDKKLGAHAGQGVAYVYARRASAWAQEAELTAADGAANDSFGSAAAISVTTAVVGAPNKTVDSAASRGAAYVFRFNGSAWVQEAELIASDGAAYDGFGGSVAISGNTVVVGASNKTVGFHLSQGAAYVYSFSGSGWVQQAELTAVDGAQGDYFGCQAALSGNPFSGSTLVLGACDKSFGSSGQQGAAYVYYSFDGSSWVPQAELTAGDGAAGDYFGAVALSGSTVAVGAYGKTVGSSFNQGAAYVFAPMASVPALPPGAALALAALLAVAGVWAPANRRTRRVA